MYAEKKYYKETPKMLIVAIFRWQCYRDILFLVLHNYVNYFFIIKTITFEIRERKNCHVEIST